MINKLDARDLMYEAIGKLYDNELRSLHLKIFKAATAGKSYLVLNTSKIKEQHLDAFMQYMRVHGYTVLAGQQSLIISWTE